MTCRDVRILLLEAEADELRGMGTSPVADHIRGCAPCAAAAGDILRATEALDGYLSDAPHGVDLDALVDGMVRDRSRRVTPIRRWRPAVWASVAMAAAAAAVIFVARQPIADGDPEITHAVATALPTLVASSGAATVAVIETDNPDITVLWFF